jgi:hypothetical protein
MADEGATRSDPMTTKRTFTYGSKKYVQLALCIVFIGMVAVMFTTGRLREGDWPMVVIVSAAVLLMCGSSMFIFLDVVISDEGVSRPFYGLRGRRMSWADIDCVACHADDAGDVTYSLRPAKRPLLRSIYIMSSIEEITQLVDVLNEQLLARQIPIFQGPGDARVRVDRLPYPEAKSVATNP